MNQKELLAFAKEATKSMKMGTITRALTSIRTQVNGMDTSVRIPKFRFKKGKYEVIDYCYE
jgi:hypothetical protein